MIRRNNRTNALIKWVIVVGDFVLLNVLLAVFRWKHPYLSGWSPDKMEVLWVACNMAMMLAQWKFGTIIHLRMVSGGDILKRVFELMVMQTACAYLIMKVVDIQLSVGWLLLQIGITLIVVGIVLRLLERNTIKWLRGLGLNTRTVTFVGTDSALSGIHEKMVKNPTLGYSLKEWYQDPAELVEKLRNEESLFLGDEMYVCLPMREQELLWELADYCDNHVIRFYYVPSSAERPGKRLKREFFDDMEIYATHDIPLENPVNMAIKRCFDMLISSIVLLGLMPLLPVIALLIKIQSPGPIFFRQRRTGINAKDFVCYKFRSMHVNADADKLQATEHDPRAFPFGSFMRKYSIDELPQFWNVLKGNMSIVGPRPHMLLHTEIYSQKIRDYMIRHFVKPGITGWAQVLGFRGETRELWQMEERVRHDIWYIEHWSIWLDLRIMWMTIRAVFVGDEKKCAENLLVTKFLSIFAFSNRRKGKKV